MKFPLPSQSDGLKPGQNKVAIDRLSDTWNMAEKNTEKESVCGGVDLDYQRTSYRTLWFHFEPGVIKDKRDECSYGNQLAYECMKLQRWDLKRVGEVLAGYQQFLEVLIDTEVLKDTDDKHNLNPRYSKQPVPSPDIDLMWRVHISRPYEYEIDMKMMFGREIRRVHCLERTYHERYARTLEILSGRNGELDRSVWPALPVEVPMPELLPETEQGKRKASDMEEPQNKALEASKAGKPENKHVCSHSGRTIAQDTTIVAEENSREGRTGEADRKKRQDPPATGAVTTDQKMARGEEVTDFQGNGDVQHDERFPVPNGEQTEQSHRKNGASDRPCAFAHQSLEDSSQAAVVFPEEESMDKTKPDGRTKPKSDPNEVLRRLRERSWIMIEKSYEKKFAKNHFYALFETAKRNKTNGYYRVRSECFNVSFVKGTNREVVRFLSSCSADTTLHSPERVKRNRLMDWNLYDASAKIRPEYPLSNENEILEVDDNLTYVKAFCEDILWKMYPEHRFIQVNVIEVPPGMTGHGGKCTDFSVENMVTINTDRALHPVVVLFSLDGDGALRIGAFAVSRRRCKNMSEKPTTLIPGGMMVMSPVQFYAFGHAEETQKESKKSSARKRPKSEDETGIHARWIQIIMGAKKEHIAT